MSDRHRSLNDNDRPLTETERRLLEAACETDTWLSLVDLDHLRCLGADDIVTVPLLVEAGLLQHDPDQRAIRITDAGRRAVE